MKTKKMIPVSSSKLKLNFKLPQLWNDLTDEQLKYYFKCRCIMKSDIKVQTCCFRRWVAGLKSLRKLPDDTWSLNINKDYFKLQEWQLLYCVHQLNFLSEQQPSDVICIEKIGKYTIVDKYIRTLPFRDYLAAEGFYQAFLKTQKDELLLQMGRLIYQTEEFKVILEPWIKLALLAYWSSLKQYFCREFPYLFKKVDSTQSGSYSFKDSVNSQIRALTGGDVTKDATVKQLDTYIALTELNEKAREADEFKRRMKK